MPEQQVVPSEKEIIDSYGSGKLATDIFDRFGHMDKSDFRSILGLCIELHNAEKIDLLSLTRAPEIEGISGSRFFTGQNFFCKAIPRLNASTREMMHSVRELVKKGGTDLAANQPNAAFAEWCKVDVVRAQEVARAAKEDDPLANEFLPIALTAGNMAEEAMGFIETCVDSRRLSGVVALGRISYADSALGRRALSTLLRALDNKPDDQLLANTLISALGIAQKTQQITCDEVLGIVKRVCETPGPLTHCYCARALSRHHKSLSEQLVALLLHALNSLDAAHKVTLQELDDGLQKLLDTSYANLAIEFVRKQLLSDKGLTLSEFQGFSATLMDGPVDRFHRVFVSWMLLGTHTLCDGLSALFHSQDRQRPINLPIQEFALSPVKQVFLCRKAIGYFFLQPVIAASILVSVLRASEDPVTSAVRDLLFDPLLLNYDGAIRDYLGRIDANDTAYSHVQLVLKQSERYLVDLRSVGTVKELHPSEHERQIEHLRVRDQMQRLHKEAEKKSVFHNLVTPCVILYGSRSLMFVEGPDNARKPVEMELKELSVAMEFPLMETIDPVGLNYMLWSFRVERLKS
jgi:hypothetical protein